MNPSTNHASLSSNKARRRYLKWGLISAAVVALFLFMFPTGGSSGHRAHPETRSKNEVKGLEVAIKGYQTEYNEWPNIVQGKDESPIILDPRNKLLPMLIVRGPSPPPAANPRGIGFYDPPPARENKKGGLTSEGALLDPWGNPYVVVIDYNNDGEVTIPEEARGKDDPETLATSVIVYSRGKPPHDTVKDYVRSWR